MKRALLAAVIAVAPAVLLAQSGAPDIIIHHAKVFTGDSAHRLAEAVAIKGNRILAVGTNDSISALAGDATKRLDAGGRVVIPGFNDAHTHEGPRPTGFALSLDHDPPGRWRAPGSPVASTRRPAISGSTASSGRACWPTRGSTARRSTKSQVIAKWSSLRGPATAPS